MKAVVTKPCATGNLVAAEAPDPRWLMNTHAGASHHGTIFIVLRERTQPIAWHNERLLDSIHPHPMQCRCPPLKIEDAIGAPRILVARV